MIFPLSPICIFFIFNTFLGPGLPHSWDSIWLVAMLQNLNFLKCLGIEPVPSVCTCDPTTWENPLCSDCRPLYRQIILCNKCPGRVLRAIYLNMDSAKGLMINKWHTPHQWTTSLVVWGAEFRYALNSASGPDPFTVLVYASQIASCIQVEP